MPQLHVEIWISKTNNPISSNTHQIKKIKKIKIEYAIDTGEWESCYAKTVLRCLAIKTGADDDNTGVCTIR